MIAPTWGLGRPAGLLLLGLLLWIAWLHYRRRPGPRRTVPSLTPWLLLASDIARRRRRVPPSVLLALHLLVAALLALAVAEPRSGRPDPAAAHRVVVLDVTTSMAAGERWNEAAAIVARLVRDAPGTTSLVSLGPSPRVLAAREPSAEAVTSLVSRLRPAATGADVGQALALARIVGGPDADVTVVSDGGVEPPVNGAAEATWVTVGEPAPNVAVVEARARTVEGQARLYARVAAYAPSQVEAALRLVVDGAERDRRRVVLVPGEPLDLVWPLSGRDRWAEVRLEGGDAMPDDDFAFVPAAAEALHVQVIGSEGPVLRALRAMPDVVLHAAGAGAYRVDGAVDATIAIGTPIDVQPPGGLVSFGSAAPGVPEDERPNSQTTIDGVSEHPIARGLDLWGMPLPRDAGLDVPPWAEPVLDASGVVVAFAGTHDGTRVVRFAFDGSDPAMAERLAFPVLVARSVAWASDGGIPPVVKVGRPIPLPRAPARIQGPNGPMEPTGTVLEAVAPGRYVLSFGTGRDARDVRIGALSGDDAESDLSIRWPGARAGTRHPAGSRRGPLAAWIAAGALAVLGLESAWRGGLRGGGRR